MTSRARNQRNWPVIKYYFRGSQTGQGWNRTGIVRSNQYKTQKLYFLS